jgi:thiaminase
MKDYYTKTIASGIDAVRRFPWENPRHYANLSAQTYYYVSHSTRLLARAASGMTVEQEGFHTRFAEHMVEEKSHHLLALHDVKALGFALHDFPELPATCLFYEPQYFKVEKSPVSLLGYILALEGLAVETGKEVMSRVTEAHGKKATSFVKVHAEDDVSHLEKAFAAIAAVPPESVEAIQKNFVQSVYAYAAMLDQISRTTESHK